MRGPGFAKLIYNTKTGQISDVETGSVNNKSEAGKKKPHGLCLNEMTAFMVKFFPAKSMDCPVIFIREKQLEMQGSQANRFIQSKTLIALSKAVGISDAFLWKIYGQEFEEINPKTVKKNIAGNGNATKEEVAKCLVDYVGERKYATDDESDALAIGIGWLIENGFALKKG